MNKLPDYVQGLLTKIAKEQGFVDFTTENQPGSNHGDNFVGVMTSVTITGNCKMNGKIKEEKLHLLVKLAPENEARRNEFMSSAVFKREVFAYTKMLPTYVQFQKDKGLSESESFLSFPKCYAAIADEENEQFVVIMEDLRPKGFTMWPKAEPIALDHVRLFVEELGKFHGISFALKEQKPEFFNELRSMKDLLGYFMTNENMKALWMVAYDRAIEALKDENHRKIVSDVKENMEKIMMECVGEGVCDPFGAITHGDCWNNNLLYQYENGVCFENQFIYFFFHLIRNDIY